MRSRTRWDGFGGWAPYVPVAQRRARAAREASRRQKKGEALDPVVIPGRVIATTVWGQAWCNHIESYRDFENRLPRGRTYARNGSVIDLKISSGHIQALVAGSKLYRVSLKIPELSTADWASVIKACAGAIDSVVELLAGRLADGVMNRLCQHNGGLFPGPRQLAMSCSCPDWATMCKHVAAVLYGVGARLDRNPELLFVLRGVSHEELVTQAVRSTVTRGPAPLTSAVEGDLGAVFGIELEASQTPRTPAPESSPAVPPPVKAPPGAIPDRRKRQGRRKTTATKVNSGRPKLTRPPARPRNTFQPKRITTAELLEHGIALSMIRQWVEEGTLQSTSQPRVFLTSPDLEKKLAAQRSK
jgi:uncharacterized Zn finger protein